MENIDHTNLKTFAMSILNNSDIEYTPYDGSDGDAMFMVRTGYYIGCSFVRQKGLLISDGNMDGRLFRAKQSHLVSFYPEDSLVIDNEISEILDRIIMMNDLR